jgi:DNA-binding response OmpR family regulator
MEPLRHTLVVRFGTFDVSLQSVEVRKAGVRIKVQQQPLKRSKSCLNIRGSHHQGGTAQPRLAQRKFGDFDQAVNIAIAKLRSALGDSAENPRFKD